jgi:exodeoxyribonuclease V beta subunit
MSTRYPCPPILGQVRGHRHAVIEASAGTGKTYTIEHLVVDLLIRGQGIDALLVLTFTERAAGELRARIRQLLVRILNNTGPPLLAGESWLIDDRARGRLEQALFSLDTAAIGTIHSFFARVLTEHAFAGRRLFDGSLEDGRTLFGLAFKRALRRELARERGTAATLLMLWLTQNSEGIDDFASRLYKLHVSRRDIRPRFDAEALGREVENNPLFDVDLQAEIDDLADALGAASVHHSTVKSLRERKLPRLAAAIRQHGRSLATVFDTEAFEAIRTVAQKAQGKRLPAGRPAELLAAINALAAQLVPLEAAVVQSCLPVVRDALETHKRETGAYDFDEIIAGVAQALKGPEGQRLITGLQARYTHGLIDEFQDTDTQQWTIFQQLFVESPANHHVYLIGDPKQAIYRFRGADVHAYIRARRQILDSGQPRIPLQRNYRSTPGLIEACNLFFDQRAREPYFDDADFRYDEPVQPGKAVSAVHADGTPSVPVHVLEIEPAEEGLKKNELFRGLAREIAREVGALLSGPRRLCVGEPGRERPVPANEIYVLTVTNRQAEQIVADLRAEGIPASLYKQDGLFQTSEARAVRDLLAAVADPRDREARARAWITPFFSVPLEVLTDLEEIPDDHPLLRRLAQWKAAADGGRLESLFAQILDDSGIVVRELLFQEGERALTNYMHLFEILLEESQTSGCGLAELVALLDGYINETRLPPREDGNVQRLETDSASVQVMSIHKSKGLQADVVFLYGGFTAPSAGIRDEYPDGETPVVDLDPSDERAKQADRERGEEQQRLYYVALTRARGRLYLPYVPEGHWSRHWKGGYKRVNDRLAAVLTMPEAAALFTVRKFRDKPPPRGLAAAGQTARSPVSWRPGRGELDLPDLTAEMDRLHQRHRAFEVTSYSRMKRDWERTEEPIEAEETYLEDVPEADPEALPEGMLPGGRDTGTLLHTILEKAPLVQTAASAGLDAWRGLATVKRVVDDAFAKSSVALRHRAAVEEIAYRALTTPVRPDEGEAIPGFCNCTREARELEFLFPFPEASHPRLADAPGDRVEIERGFVKGFIDLVVEHQGRVYAVDWKSDVLDSYDRAAVAACVQELYSVQADLYALALVKALEVKTSTAYEGRFGGMFYVFLRGLGRDVPDGSGVYFVRPAWRDILDYEQELIRFGEQTRGGAR